MSEARPEEGRRVADLGAIEGAALIFGGPYGNLEATGAVLAEAERLGIRPSRVICTGDVVAYCADPQATVDAVRSFGAVVIQGNCEESLAEGSQDCGCGYEEGSVCDLLSQRWFAYAQSRLDDEAIAWMRGLPGWARLRMAGRDLVVVHGAPSQINGMVFASTPEDVKRREIEASGGDGVICGHTGLPFSQIIDGRLWHNAGVIGQPANDGTTRAWYGVLRPLGAGISIEHHAFTYDHLGAAAKMRERGLPEEYAQSLRTGRWHNCDILPPEERARQGRPFEPETVMWSPEAPPRAASG